MSKLLSRLPDLRELFAVDVYLVHLPVAKQPFKVCRRPAATDRALSVIEVVDANGMTMANALVTGWDATEETKDMFLDLVYTLFN